MKPLVLVFAKAPRLGQAKSRLAAEIGVVHALRHKRRLDARTLRRAASPMWVLGLAVTRPQDLRGRFPGVWPGTVARQLQGPGDLGARMARAFRGRGRRAMAIIGSDVPELSVAAISDALKRLRGADAVLGPAGDGGYWLIALAPRRVAPGGLTGVRWSSPDALADTLAALPASWRVRMARQLDDVDTAADLSRLSARARPGR